jgi:2-oxoglutarate dehydrogenase E2 component (dihydrolipoamide succinyltransferase)
MKKIRSERELVNYLRMIREADETAAPAPDPAAPAAPAPAAPAPEAPAAQEQEAKPITVEDIVEKLNVVRSGRSTKDLDVKRELDEYINQFDEDEKTALLAFLQGLGQILTSGIDSQDAVDPADPYALQIKKSLGVKAANSAATPSPTASAAPAPAPGPVPIKVGG